MLSLYAGSANPADPMAAAIFEALSLNQEHVRGLLKCVLKQRPKCLGTVTYKCGLRQRSSLWSQKASSPCLLRPEGSISRRHARRRHCPPLPAQWPSPCSSPAPALWAPATDLPQGAHHSSVRLLLRKPGGGDKTVESPAEDPLSAARPGPALTPAAGTRTAHEEDAGRQGALPACGFGVLTCQQRQPRATTLVRALVRVQTLPRPPEPRVREDVTFDPESPASSETGHAKHRHFNPSNHKGAKSTNAYKPTHQTVTPILKKKNQFRRHLRKKGFL